MVTLADMKDTGASMEELAEWTRENRLRMHQQLGDGAGVVRAVAHPDRRGLHRGVILQIPGLLPAVMRGVIMAHPLVKHRSGGVAEPPDGCSDRAKLVEEGHCLVSLLLRVLCHADVLSEPNLVQLFVRTPFFVRNLE